MNDYDVLGVIGQSVRELRRPPAIDAEYDPSNLPVWPYGLAFDVLLGVGAIIITARRLHTPTRKLPPATRIA